MSQPTHVTHMIDDYVLGLLSPRQRRQVEHHAADCPTCRQRLGAERLLVARVRDALGSLPAPPPGRRFAPSPPPKPVHAARYTPWMRASILVAAILVVLGSGMSLARGYLEPGWGQPVGPVAVTATLAPTTTHDATPTAHALAPSASPTPIAGLPADPAAIH